jgi:hypothetical protein
MFSQLSRHRGQLSSRSVGGDNLLQRELDGEDLPSRLSLSRVNALPRSNGMQWSFNSLAPPTIDNLGDNSSSRNHHRHSSMSTSPRVLEASASSVSPNQARGDRFPSLQDADMGQGSTIYKKLEDVLYFLDLQRLPPSSVSKPIRSVHFLQTFINATSWLRPGGVYLGVQSFEEEPTNSVSALTRQLRRTRFDRSHDWKVKVVIDEVNYTDMSIAGSMTAYDLPDAQERQSVTTFWTGEVSNHADPSCNLF